MKAPLVKNLIKEINKDIKNWLKNENAYCVFMVSIDNKAFEYSVETNKINNISIRYGDYSLINIYLFDYLSNRLGEFCLDGFVIDAIKDNSFYGNETHKVKLFSKNRNNKSYDIDLKISYTISN